MANLMDNIPFNSHNAMSQNDALQMARQNPRAFEEYIKQNNPEAYRQAIQIRNSANPQAIIMRMAQQNGINPNILRMLGIG